MSQLPIVELNMHKIDIVCLSGFFIRKSYVTISYYRRKMTVLINEAKKTRLSRLLMWKYVEYKDNIKLLKIMLFKGVIFF